MGDLFSFTALMGKRIAMTDEQIVSLIEQKKESKALLKLYQFFPPVEKFLVNHGASKEEALDVYQDALYVLCEKIGSGNFALTAKLSTYLFSVSKYLWKAELKKKNKTTHSNFELDEGFSQVQQEELQVNESKAQLAEEALQTLGEKCLAILKAFYHQGKRMSEIARLFGFSSEKSAKNQKYKCLEKAKLKYGELAQQLATH